MFYCVFFFPLALFSCFISLFYPIVFLFLFYVIIAFFFIYLDVFLFSNERKKKGHRFGLVRMEVGRI